MDISRISFSDFETVQVQQLLLGFISMESGHTIVDGKFIRNPNRLTIDFIAEHFGCDEQHALIVLTQETLEVERKVPKKQQLRCNEKFLEPMTA